MTRSSTRGLRGDGDATAVRLLEAGRIVLNRRGYGATRVDDVVARAGVSHGTFYLHFRDMEDLLHRLAVDCHADVEPLVTRLAGMDAPDTTTVRAWMGDFVAAYLHHGVVLRAWLEHVDADPLMEWLAHRDVGGLIDGFAALVPKTAARPDPYACGLALFSMVEHFTAYLAYRDDEVERVVVEALTRLVRGALTPAAGERDRDGGTGSPGRARVPSVRSPRG